MTCWVAARRARRQAATWLSIGAVIFDLDGTLLDSEPLCRRAFQAALAVFGQTMDAAMYGELIGLATPDRAARLRQCFGPSFPADAFLAEYYRHKQNWIAGGIALKPGVRPLLDWLREHDVQAAVATACSEATARGHLAQAGLSARFRCIISRDQVARRKPYPDLFLRAAADLGVAEPDCLVLEDSAPGIEAAVAAGMIPVLVPDLAPIPPETRRKLFAELPDLHAVRALLAQL